MRKQTALLVLLAATAIGPAAPVVLTPSVAHAEDRADDLYRLGVDAFKAGKLEEAHRYFADAWSLKQGIDIAANLGVVELKLGKHREAAEHLRYALDLFPVNGSAEARQKLVENLAEAKRQVGEVKIACNVRGAKVMVEERDLGTTPLPAEIFVEPGQKRFTASLEGYESADITVTIEPGGKTTVELSLQAKKDGGGGGGEGGGPVGPPPDESLPVWPAPVMGGLAAVGIGLGVGFIVVAENAKSAVEDSGCRAADCGAAFQDDVDDYNLGRSVAIPSFIVGGIALVGAVTYGIVLATDTPAEEKLPGENLQGKTTVLPLVGPDGAGFFVAHTF